MRFNILQLRNWLPGFLTDFFAEHPISASLISADADNALVEGTDDKLFVPQSEGGGGASYLVYTALLTQIGASAPVPTILGEPTISATIVYAREAEGVYTATADSPIFVAGKTLILHGNTKLTADTVSFITAVVRTSTTVITISTSYQTGSGGDGQSSDGGMTEMAFEIRTYS